MARPNLLKGFKRPKGITFEHISTNPNYGKFTAYFADGNVESSGNIVKESDSFGFYKDNGELLISLKYGDPKNENVLYAKSSGEIRYEKVLGPDGAASDGR